MQIHIDRDLHFSYDDSIIPESVFQIIKKIGSGSFGSVYQIVYMPTMRLFAGKLVDSDLLKEDAGPPDLKSKSNHLIANIRQSFSKMRNVLSPYTLRYYNCIDYSYDSCHPFDSQTFEWMSNLTSSSTSLRMLYRIRNSSSVSSNLNSFQIGTNPLKNSSLKSSLSKIPVSVPCPKRKKEVRLTIGKKKSLLLLMEFCDRGSIRDVLDDRNSVLSEDQIMIIMKNVLTALDILHNQQHLVHGDLKCANILLNSDGFVKVSGFEMSQNFKSGTSKNYTILGRPYWMSPETITNNVFSPESDVWSAGITAIEMSEGAPPYIELKPTQAIVEICKNGFPGYRFPNGHSPIFKDFISHCLEYDPSKRWTISQLLQHPFITYSSKLPRRPTMKPLINKVFSKIEVDHCDNNNFSQDEAKSSPGSIETESEEVKNLILSSVDLKSKIAYQSPSNQNIDGDIHDIYPELNERIKMRNEEQEIIKLSTKIQMALRGKGLRRITPFLVAGLVINFLGLSGLFVLFFVFILVFVLNRMF